MQTLNLNTPPAARSELLHSRTGGQPQGCKPFSADSGPPVHPGIAASVRCHHKGEIMGLNVIEHIWEQKTTTKKKNTAVNIDLETSAYLLFISTPKSFSPF